MSSEMKLSGLWVYGTFNNISVKSWWSVLLEQETGVLRETHRPALSHRQTLSHNCIEYTSPVNEIDDIVHHWFSVYISLFI
jgi:hypothetical protein